jgi:predicted outer membrane lipoprotein
MATLKCISIEAEVTASTARRCEASRAARSLERSESRDRRTSQPPRHPGIRPSAYARLRKLTAKSRPVRENPAARVAWLEHSESRDRRKPAITPSRHTAFGLCQATPADAKSQPERENPTARVAWLEHSESRDRRKPATTPPRHTAFGLCQATPADAKSQPVRENPAARVAWLERSESRGALLSDGQVSASCLASQARMRSSSTSSGRAPAPNR